MHVSGRALCLYFLRHLLRGLGYYGNAEEACRRSACRALSTAISPKVSVARALASGESASSSCLRSVATLKRLVNSNFETTRAHPSYRVGG